MDISEQSANQAEDGLAVFLSEFDRRQLEELVSRHNRLKKQNVTKGLFDKQLNFLRDPSRFKAALCSRRSGKTYVTIRALVDTALRFPGTDSVYITLTRPNAKKLVWRPLKEIDRDFKLGIHFHNTDLVATFPNGSTLTVTGASDSADIEKLRGSANKMVVIDECASFPAYIEPLIEEVLEPTLEDYAGTLMVIGTPGEACCGYFYDITTESEKHGYSLHSWTVLDNSMFPLWAGDPEWAKHAVLWMDELKARKGFDESNPAFLREYRGIWVTSSDNLMYHIEPKDFLTPEESDALDLRIANKDPNIKYVLGVDLGWHDNSSFYVLGYDRYSMVSFEVEGFAKSGLIVEAIANAANLLIEKYDPESVKVDSAGEGKIIVKSLASEIGQRYGIPVEAANKSKKASFVRLWDSDIRVGRFKFRPGSQLARQMKRLQWDDKFQREREELPADRADAGLYAYRELLHWAPSEREKPRPKPGTPEHTELIVQEMEEQEEEQALARGELGPNWFDSDS